ncbi:MAG: hypothetical protein EPO10_11775 [Reyranella sp.]|uniref:hypothetical protein n=1 Tax=Reyranella sp. TaxID=1929291 RepID=UPI0012092FF8|nr:hypothetical protein [Reyranella sp.]TAJ96851.1 MAG: hypothetical protein EPO41_04810 [Reyranella sp.]TBR28682.1 MAG: hypothetical protein EPO10_11775 [Reyranella sp.]
MPRKKKDTSAESFAVDFAVGLCGWLLIVEMMGTLERRGVLKEKDSLRVIANATTALEALASENPSHPTFRIAKVIMDSQLVGWNREDLK